MRNFLEKAEAALLLLIAAALAARLALLLAALATALALLLAVLAASAAGTGGTTGPFYGIQRIFLFETHPQNG